MQTTTPSYRRDIFEKGFKDIKAILAKETGNYHTDTYTGKPLKPGERWDFEHIISTKEFSTLEGVDRLTAEQQSAIINHRKNIGTIDRVINQSKSKYELTEWAMRKSNGRQISNAEYYEIDIKKVMRLREEILSFLKVEIRKH